MTNSIFSIISIVFFIILAGLFAGSETGMYRLSRLRLRLSIEKKKLSFIILGRCLKDSNGLLLSMLIGTNLSYYLVTNIVTNIFLTKVETEHAAEFFATLLTAPTLFIFSELIPKNIFFYRSDVLMPYLSPMLYAFKKVLSFCGIIPLLKFISSLLMRLSGLASYSKTAITSTQRHQVQAFLQDTHEEGIFSSVQTEIINRLVGISHITIRSVMVAINNVQTVDINSDNGALLNKLKKHAFSRLPVKDNLSGNINSFVNIYEALSSSEKFADLHNFIKPILKLNATTTVTDAINIMQKENQKIVLVIKTGRANHEKPLGIVTMKDLAEELLGELAEW
ncbi:MAG: CNNM domain-containing protein [Sedimentisphaerales bacterium]|nr:CNNM domain-containing protein [Sedimentisphaerales bacterium]